MAYSVLLYHKCHVLFEYMTHTNIWRQSYIPDMAACGPPTYFCGPWTFFCYVEKQHISFTKTNLVKSCTYFFSKVIKRTNFSLICRYYYSKISFFFNSAAWDAKFLTNLARDQKSLVTPAIYSQARLVNCNKLGYNENLVIANKINEIGWFQSLLWHVFPGYNKQIVVIKNKYV